MSKPAVDKGVINPNAFRARGQVPERKAWVGLWAPLRVLALSSSLQVSQETMAQGHQTFQFFKRS